MPEVAPYHDPLDLLCRFAPTPLTTEIRLDFADVLLQTNDLNLFPSSANGHSPARLQEQTSSQQSQSLHRPRCLWKIVRDMDVRHKVTEVSIVMSGSLIVYSMGPACIIGADRERKEILAFIGQEVDAGIFQDSIFPALRRLTEFVTRQESPQSLRVAEVAVGGR